MLNWILSLFVIGSTAQGALPVSSLATRTNLVEAILTEDRDRQFELVRTLADSPDPFVKQVLEAWRGGVVYLWETDDAKVPILLDAQTDNEGRAGATRIADATRLNDENGSPAFLSSFDLTAADTSSKLRRVIKTTLDIFALDNANPKMRRDAVTKLGQDQNVDYLPYFSVRLKTEADAEVKNAIDEAMALTRLASMDSTERIGAARALDKMRSINSLSLLQKTLAEVKTQPEKYEAEFAAALSKAVYDIENYIWWGNQFGTAFRGLSLGAVLLVAALGLAITFGLMGIINMAHGEIIMVGAYTAYFTQNLFQQWVGSDPKILDLYFIPALLFSFIIAGAVGFILERCVIRFLYKRPLESLLATWGVSLVLQQLFRQIFGAANVQVGSPGWLSGSLVIHDVLLAYNRLFVIGFAIFVVALTYWMLTRTSLGLQIRAVMQNRTMASALGVRTNRVNMMTFAFGSGLAGMAGACLSQIGNVGPSLGQNYIVDCFMVVVLGGVGNLVGTISAALGIGLTDQILQPWLGAVMGKITVLAGIILFLQWRPSGLFVTRTRNLEG